MNWYHVTGNSDDVACNVYNDIKMAALYIHVYYLRFVSSAAAAVAKALGKGIVVNLQLCDL